METIKVPTLAVEKFHLGADGYAPAAEFEAAELLAQRETEMGFAKAILEKIAREDGVERVGGMG